MVEKKTITIELKLFVTLSKFLPKNPDHYEVTQGKTVEDMMADLKLSSELVKLIFINGKRQDKSYLLQANDRVGLFPPVGGG
ncbi:MAG: MoaD/ThiS family protein [Pseudomonadota bacterium]